MRGHKKEKVKPQDVLIICLCFVLLLDACPHHVEPDDNEDYGTENTWRQEPYEKFRIIGLSNSQQP